MNKDTLTKNTAYFTGALMVQKILAFIYFWLISNSLFPEQLGQYIFALSFTALFAIFIDLGLAPILTREASKSKANANLYLQNVIGMKIPLAIITLIVAAVVINITGKSPQIILLVYLASFIMLLDSFSLTFWVIFRARQNLKYESIGTILVQLIIFSLGILALKTSGQVRHLMVALLAASTFNFLFSLSLLKLKLGFSIIPRLDKKIVKYFIKIIPAFALAGIFVKIYNASDVVLLSYLDSDEAVAFFAIPAKIVFALQQIIPAAFAAVIYPAFSYYYANSKLLLTKTFNKAFAYLVIMSLPITAGLIIILPEIINTLWPSYARTIPTFFIMALAIPFIFLAFPTGYLLNATDHQKNNTINRGIIMALAVFLNVLLIPRLSFLGAGITFLITNFILLFLDFYWVRKVIDLELDQMFKVVFKSAVATVIMIIGIILIKPVFNLLLVIPFGMGVYFVSLYLVKGFTMAEVSDVLKSGFKK